MIVKAKGPSGPAKISSDDPKHALGLVQYLRTIGYTAWIEDTNGNEIEETVLKNAIKEMPPRVKQVNANPCLLAGPALEPETIREMSLALEGVCKTLGPADGRSRRAACRSKRR